MKPDRIAESVFQQGSNPYRRLDAPSSHPLFVNTQVSGKVEILLHPVLNEQAITPGIIT